MSDKELIAEIRDLHERQDRREGEPPMCLACSPADWPCDAVRAADALEAATRVPVQGEPNDDREALAIAAMEAQYKFYPSMPNHSWTDISENDRKGYRAVADAMRATVPDTTTERFEKAEHDRLYWRRRYQSMHKRAKTADAERDAALAALDGAPEPEWESG